MKKKKRMYRAWLVFFLVFLLFFSVPLIYGYIISKDANKSEPTNSDKLKEIGYSLNDIEILIKDNQILKYALENEYDKNLIKHVEIENFNIDKIKEYYKYEKNNEEASIEEAIVLVNHGISTEYSEKLINIVKEKYFIRKNLERYLSYTKKTNYSDIVKMVNCNLDYDYYTNIKAANTDSGNLILVNKYYYLNSDFNGNNLVNIESKYGAGMLNSEVYDAFKQLSDAAAQEGLSILSQSAYRSYNTQYTLYNNYIAKNGQAWTDKWSARAGHSEHQTGLALDVRTNRSTDLGYFVSTNEFKWMLNNAHTFGFILRFPSNGKDLTGYDYEPWHYRYVGVEYASKIKEENITFEEYYSYYINNKEEN